MAAPNQLPSTNQPDAAKLPANLDFRTYQELKINLHRFLLNRLDLETIATYQDGNDPGSDDQIRWRAFATIQEVVAQIKVPFTPQEREQFSRTILDEVFALGPIEPLLKDTAIDDILVNGAREVYVERAGVLEETKVVFKDDAHLMRIIQKIVAAIGRRIDASSPMVDARLADGSRVNVIIPPLALDGPHLSIRRFGHIPITDADLLSTQALTPHMLGLLKAAVAARLNILISGGTGAGKTTLLNVLSGFISTKERIVTIEDSAELQLKQRHVVRLECRPPDP
jgi:pilus assembly protein CpaF